jgi:hypothetical protein
MGFINTSLHHLARRVSVHSWIKINKFRFSSKLNCRKKSCDEWENINTKVWVLRTCFQGACAFD